MIAELTGIGLLNIKEATLRAQLIIPLLLVTLYWWHYTASVMRRAHNVMPREQAVAVDDAVFTPPPTAFLQPVLLEPAELRPKRPEEFDYADSEEDEADSPCLRPRRSTPGSSSSSSSTPSVYALAHQELPAESAPPETRSEAGLDPEWDPEDGDEYESADSEPGPPSSSGDPSLVRLAHESTV